MKYHNTKTGVTFSSPFVIAGGDWVALDGNSTQKEISEAGTQKSKPIGESKVQPEEISQTKPTSVQEPEENTEDFDGITIAQIKQELDAFGVEYDQKAKKRELYDLMMQQGK